MIQSRTMYEYELQQYRQHVTTLREDRIFLPLQQQQQQQQQRLYQYQQQNEPRTWRKCYYYYIYIYTIYYILYTKNIILLGEDRAQTIGKQLLSHSILYILPVVAKLSHDYVRRYVRVTVSAWYELSTPLGVTRELPDIYVGRTSSSSQFMSHTFV